MKIIFCILFLAFASCSSNNSKAELPELVLRFMNKIDKEYQENLKKSEVYIIHPTSCEDCIVRDINFLEQANKCAIIVFDSLTFQSFAKHGWVGSSNILIVDSKLLVQHGFFGSYLTMVDYDRDREVYSVSEILKDD